MNLKDFNFSRIETISENHYLGVMTIGDYASLIKGVECDNDFVINLAELKAKEYNDDTETNSVFITPINLFLTENGLVLFDNFSTIMILNLEERFMTNKLVVIVYVVNSEKDAKKIHMQLLNEKR